MFEYPEYPETHKQGWVMLHNLDMISEMDLDDADLGIQIANDGRVWVCVNGVALLRFRPTRKAGS